MAQISDQSPNPNQKRTFWQYRLNILWNHKEVTKKLAISKNRHREISKAFEWEENA